MLPVTKKISLFILLFISVSITAQVNLQWVRTYTNGTADSNMLAVDMAIDRNGYVFVTGSSEDNGNNTRIVTLKYSPTGNIEWVQRYKDTSWSLSRPWSLHLDDSDNVYISGDEIGLLTLKYNTFGVMQWARNYKYGNWYNEAWDITTDDSGYVYTTGIATYMFVTMKYNRDGNLQWLVMDSFVGGSAPSFITVDTLGNVYVAGRGYGNFYTCNTFKYNRDGIKQWEQVYSGNATNGGAEPKGIAIDSNGDIVVGASSYSIGGGDFFAAIKYGPDGSLHWATVYKDTARNYNYPMAFACDKSGNAFITGGINQFSSSTDAYGTIKINSTGAVQWNKEYSKSEDNFDMAFDVTVDKNGFVYVTGESGGDTTGKDIAIIKYDQNGKQLWAECYTSGLDEIGFKIAVSEHGDVYVLGEQYTSPGQSGYIILKYNQWATGFNKKSKPILCYMYPNPAMQNATLEFDNSSAKKCTLTLYDACGRIVRTTTDITISKIEVEKQNLSNGLYFYELEAESQIIARGKLIFK